MSGRTSFRGSPPGPPRGRRHAVGWGLRDRIEAVRHREIASGPGQTASALLQVLRDVILLLRDCATDARIPAARKWWPVAFAVAYATVPWDAIPDDLPVVGHVDDALVFGWATRRFLQAAGYEVLYEHWRGTDEGLAAVLTLAGVEH